MSYAKGALLASYSRRKSLSDKELSGAGGELHPGVEWPLWCSPKTQTAWTAACPRQFKEILDTKQRKSEQYEIGDSPLWLLIVCDLFNDTQSHIFPTHELGLESLGQTFRGVGFNFADSCFDEVWLFSEFTGRKVRLYPA
jgi:hypothetical protein